MADHLVIGYCHGGTVRAEFAASLVSAVMECLTPVDAVLTYASGPNISTARNKICDDFLTRQRAPWLLMCDTDMVFTPADVDRLVCAADPGRWPVLGGLCYSQNAGGDPWPTMYELAQKDSGELAFARLTSWRQNAHVKVSATGAAFLLIHRTALEKVAANSGDAAAPWFRESPVGAPLALMGEDMTFCLRCAAASVPVHVHTGVRAGHMKTMMI